MLIEKIVTTLQAIVTPACSLQRLGLAEIARQEATTAPPAGMAMNYPNATGHWARFEWDAKDGAYKNQQGTPTTPDKILAMLRDGWIVAPASSVPLKSQTALTEEGDMGLKVAAQRIVAALKLEKQGITSEYLVARVLEFEKPYSGVVQ